MPDGRDVTPDHHAGEPVVYCYDGSFEGLICCVFESYDKKEIPMDIMADDAQLPWLLNMRRIATDEARTKRVLTAVQKKIGREALEMVRDAYLTCHPRKEMLILQFVRLGFRCGPSTVNRLADAPVHTLNTAVQHLKHEAHLYTGFTRFSELNGTLVAEIEPKNFVLPLLTRHFCERYPHEQYLIYDKTHGMILMYQGGRTLICSVDSFTPLNPGKEEMRFRTLWRLFYDTIEIKERHNPRCRMSHMPKRYWRYMTELAQQPMQDMLTRAKNES
jgi:probable DNA metabolism protein